MINLWSFKTLMTNMAQSMGEKNKVIHATSMGELARFPLIKNRENIDATIQISIFFINANL